MVFATYLFFSVTNLLLYITGKKNRTFSLLSVGFVIVFVIGKRYLGGAIAYDLQNYAVKYDAPLEMPNIEFGFKLINILATKMGLPFYAFYMMLSGTAVTWMFCSAIRAKCNLHLFITIYLLYFVLIPIDQLRNVCAFTILFSSLPDIANNDKRVKLKYAIRVILASTFHITYLAYLLLIPCLYKENISKIIFRGSILITFIGFLLNRVNLLSTFVKRVISAIPYLNNRFGHYTETKTSLSVFIPMIVLFICCIGLICLKNTFENTHSIDYDKMIADGNNIVYSLVLFSGIFLPLMLLNSTTYRFIRDVSLVYIAWTSRLVNFSSSKRRKRMVMFSNLAIAIVWFMFDIVIKGYWKDYVDYFFNISFCI